MGRGTRHNLITNKNSMTTFAFVFPGQGSQSVGMLDAWGDHPAVRQTLQEASDALGENLSQLIKEGPTPIETNVTFEIMAA